MRAFATRLTPCLLLILIGCGAKHYIFQVAVKNATDVPLTVGFVKLGPPFESRWASPEDFTNLPPSNQPQHWGRLVPQGKTYVTHVDADLAPGSRPSLRIYSGEHSAADLLAISRGGGDRLDLTLSPAENNDYLITNNKATGALSARLRRLSDDP